MGPDFLCIGAQRAGTTWLYRAMQHHPGIWLPPVKELHYFDRQYPPAALAAGTRPYAGERFTMTLKKRLRAVGFTLKAALLAQGGRHFSWMWRYHFARPSDTWYASLFRPAQGQLAGDITPAYSVLDAATVRHVGSLLPGARIVLVLRNPVERAWSAAMRNLARATGRDAADIAPGELVDAFRRPGPRLRGDYLRTLANWERVYPPEQVHIAFYDDIYMRPVAFLNAVYAFLGLDTPDGAIPAHVAQRVNAGPRRRMPHAARIQLSRMYLDDMRALHERFGGHATAWFESAQQTLHTARPVAVAQ